MTRLENRMREHLDYVDKLRTDLENEKRLKLDLMQALREQCAKPAMKDVVLIEAMVRGIAEEGSVGSTRYGR